MAGRVRNEGADKYVFMWGQYQSIMHGCYQQPQLFFLQGWKPAFTPFFSYKNGYMAGFFPERGILALRESGKAALKPTEGKRRLEFSRGRRRIFWKFISRLEREKLALMDDAKLARLFEIYGWCLTGLFIAFTYSTPFSTYFLEEEIRRILRTKLPEKQILNAFIILSTPPELDETQLERMDWLELHSGKDKGDLELMAHARKYPGLFANVYDEKEALNFLRNKLANEKPDKNEERKIRENLVRARREQEELYLKFKGTELRQYSQLLQNLAIERFKVKLCWGGAEFLALNLFREIAKRGNARLSDLFFAYTPQDVISLIKKHKKIPEMEVKRRKGHFCIFFEGKSTKFKTLSGEKSRRKMQHVLQGSLPIGAKELVGQTANLGRATGTARIILAHDLRQFERDLHDFRDGEVLVTTMTSPGMVLIAKKAAAIVADEGGICSHAAVISRELDIPCIVGTKDATRIFKTGDKLEVDATRGVVRRLQ
ncbi:MAG TPA: PEP-utilizing enzyme [Candidatus Norongarragalinales archaeon]|nr:PEP-utilizing enzyme [Candidatus Norongarragalinales archaeon]